MADFRIERALLSSYAVIDELRAENGQLRREIRALEVAACDRERAWEQYLYHRDEVISLYDKLYNQAISRILRLQRRRGTWKQRRQR